MAFTNMTNNYQSSKYIVDVAGDTPFATIQSAIDQVLIDFGGVPTTPVTIEIRPGIYTESLILVENVSLSGTANNIALKTAYSGIEQVVIIGQHIAPATAGQITFSNLVLQNNVNIFDDSTTNVICNIGFYNCLFNVSGVGFIISGINWTCDIAFDSCSDISVNNGIIQNLAGSAISIMNSSLGAGSTSQMFIAGPLSIFNSRIYCQMISRGDIEIDNSIFANQIELRNAGTCTINNSYLISTATLCFDTEVGRTSILNNVVIDFNGGPGSFAISGAGTVSIGQIVFVDNSAIDTATVVGHASTVQTGGLIVDGPMTAPLVYGSPVGGTKQMMVIDDTGLVGSAAVPSGGGFTWYPAPNDGPLSNNSGYVNTKAAALLTVTLPVTSPLGSTIIVQGSEAGAFGWSLAQNAGQNVQLFGVSSTPGITGSLSSTLNSDSVSLVCTVADLTWNAYASGGNITVV